MGEGIYFISLLVVLLAIYFIPTLVAHSNKKDDTIAIFLLNLLLGWTFLGWVIALVWAATKDKKQKTNESI